MSAFYVGQRVRVKYCNRADRQHLVGKDAVIVETIEFSWRGYGLDICPIQMDPLEGGWWCFSADQLEPITPPGLESLDEINALYEPEPCTADVDSRGFDLAKAAERFRVLHWPDPWVGLPE